MARLDGNDRVLNRTDLEPQLPGAPTQDAAGLTLRTPSVDNPNIVLPQNQEAKQLNATEAQVSTTARSKFENTAFGKAVGATAGTIKGAIQIVQGAVEAAQTAVNTVTGAVESTINTVTGAVEDTVGAVVGTVEDTVSGTTKVVGDAVGEVGSAVIGGAATGAAAGAIVGTLAKKSGVGNKVGKAVAIGAAAGAGIAVAGTVIAGVRSRLNPKGITPDGLNKQYSPDKVPPESLAGKKTDPFTGAVKSVTDNVNSVTRTVGSAVGTVTSAAGNVVNTVTGTVGSGVQAASSVSTFGSSIASGAIIGGVTGGVVGGLISNSGMKNKVGKIAKTAAIGVGVGVGLGALQNRLNTIKNTVPNPSPQPSTQSLPKPQIPPKTPAVNTVSEQRVKIVEVKKQQTDETYPIVTREPLKYSYISKLTGKPVVDEDFTGTKANDLPPLPEWATRIPIQVSYPRYVPEFPDYYEQNKYGQTVIVKTAFLRPSMGNLVKYTTKELIE